MQKIGNRVIREQTNVSPSIQLKEWMIHGQVNHL